jgi:hypothetical protein
VPASGAGDESSTLSGGTTFFSFFQHRFPHMISAS